MTHDFGPARSSGPGSAEVSSFAPTSCRAALRDGAVPGFARLLATTRGDRSLEQNAESV